MRIVSSKNKTVRKKKIANLLRKTLLQGGKMEHALYEHELEEHIDYWYEGLKTDRDEFVFAVTENSGDVAMVLITADKTVYITHIQQPHKWSTFEIRFEPWWNEEVKKESLQEEENEIKLQPK